MKPELFEAGPILIDPFMKYVRGNLSYFKEISGGGGAVPPEKQRQFNSFMKEHGCDIEYEQGYGMTEMTSVVVMNISSFRPV